MFQTEQRGRAAIGILGDSRRFCLQISSFHLQLLQCGNNMLCALGTDLILEYQEAARKPRNRKRHLARLFRTEVQGVGSAVRGLDVCSETEIQQGLRGMGYASSKLCRLPRGIRQRRSDRICNILRSDGKEDGSLAQDTRNLMWFNYAKGFGFLAREGGPAVFVHSSALVADGYETL